MAEAIHQTETPPPAAPPETAIVPPRSQDPAPAPEPRDADEKAAREAKDRMSKTQGFWNRLAPAKEEETKKPAEAQPEKKAKEAPAEPETPPKAAEPDKKPKAKKKEQEIDPIELARATGQEIGREMAKATQSANVPRGTQSSETTEEPELPEEFRADVAVFEEMSRLDPKRYGNIKKELARYAAEETKYIEKWEAEHEGQDYDPESDEHNAFYSKIQPKFEQKDFKAAEKSLLKKEVRNELSQELKQHEVESERRRERAATIEPEVKLEMFNGLGQMLTAIDPENAALAKDSASLQTLKDKNELAYDVLGFVHDETKPVVTAAMRLFRSVEAPDPNNPLHDYLFKLIWEAEDRISRMPLKERYDNDGRLFATQADYTKMDPADKSKHWYIGEKEALHLIRGQAITRTKTIYEQESQKIARYSKRTNSTQLPNQPSERKTEITTQQRPDNGSPTVGGRGTLPGDSQSGATKPQTGRDLLFGRLLGS